MSVRSWLAAVALPVLAAGACQRGTASDVAVAETMAEMGDAISALQQDNALLQSQVDSLRTQLARQDTLLRQLGAVVGAQLPR